MATETFQLSFPLPRSLEARVYVRLIIQAKSIMIFLTTAAADELGTPPPMGSFVYALPDKLNPGQPLSTPLYTAGSSEDFTTRLARLIAKKAQLPVYVANSMSFSSTGLGGTVEEEMEAFRRVVEVVTVKLQDVLGITTGVSAMSVSSS
ncbi:hypothetical protein J7T55_001977 [Diaporthe amygdali]|uniref:uncharacterized protein n=1 Tax=Phomopsis amygdali TaxID=1214568 RepID=UPI0022FEB8C6|nr:uncharacterized protein J7T55_001977 [Diaporthe amygdali]KAJ0117777.1 hypothetical protein J7T55_001977 [Diaporthe amygdali]